MHKPRKPLIIAGNGPSVKDLDYSLFPPEFEVFRCNQFYLEDKYYLGKNVHGVFYNPKVFATQMKITGQLEKHGIYVFQDIYSCGVFHRHLLEKPDGHAEEMNIADYLNAHYFGVRNSLELLETLEPFVKAHAHNCNFYNKWYTTGIMMLISAIALGYREIYLTGIDFYKSRNYLYPTKEPPTWESHSKEIDIQGLELAKQYAHLYTLVPSCALAQTLPLSPHKDALSCKEIARLGLGVTKSFKFSDVVDIDIQERLYQMGIEERPKEEEPKILEKFGRRQLLKRLFASMGIKSDNSIVRFCLDAYRILRGCCGLLKNPKARALLWKHRKRFCKAEPHNCAKCWADYQRSADYKKQESG